MAKRARHAARSRAARKGWATRRAAETVKAFRHGQRARERSERRLTPAQKGARTRAANRVIRDLLHAKRSDAAKRGWVTRRRHERGKRSGGGRKPEPIAIESLGELEDYGDFEGAEVFDIETAPDSGELSVT